MKMIWSSPHSELNVWARFVDMLSVVFPYLGLSYLKKDAINLLQNPVFYFDPYLTKMWTGLFFRLQYYLPTKLNLQVLNKLLLTAEQKN